VRAWFRGTLGEPTLPQRLGWPAIASGQNMQILAPTGSGKTLAAFLACLVSLWRIDPLPLFLEEAETTVETLAKVDAAVRSA